MKVISALPAGNEETKDLSTGERSIASTAPESQLEEKQGTHHDQDNRWGATTQPVEYMYAEKLKAFYATTAPILVLPPHPTDPHHQQAESEVWLHELTAHRNMG